MAETGDFFPFQYEPTVPQAVAIVTHMKSQGKQHVVHCTHHDFWVSLGYSITNVDHYARVCLLMVASRACLSLVLLLTTVGPSITLKKALSKLGALIGGGAIE